MANVRTIRSKVESELLDASGFQYSHPLPVVDWKRKMAIFCDESLSDSQWSSLSRETKVWLNEAINAIERGEDVPEYPDEEEVQQRRREASGKSGQNRAHNLETKNECAGHRAKEIMLEYGIRVKPDELHARLTKEGYRYSIHTLKVVMAEFRRGLKILEEKGYLAKKVKGL